MAASQGFGEARVRTTIAEGTLTVRNGDTP
jgi:hypothetical protein